MLLKKLVKAKYSKKETTTLRSFKSKFHIYTGEQLHWLQVVFKLKFSVFQPILPWVLLCFGYSCLISLLHHFGFFTFIELSKVLPQVILSLNIVLSLLLAFRTNSAHDRFWEGRKLWGSLVNTVRNLTRGIWIEVNEYEPRDRTKKERTLRQVVAFTVAMKLHLRREPVNHELSLLISELQYSKLTKVNHPPLEIAFWIGDFLQHQYELKNLNIFQMNSLQELLDDLVDILGGCERILKTPMPLIYTMILKMLLIIYFLLLPVEMVGGLHLWTGPIVGFISLVLLGIDEIGAEIEEPFGHDPNDLPLDLICSTMHRNVEDLITCKRQHHSHKLRLFDNYNNQNIEDLIS
ncbi:bestrophin family protein [Chlorogloeopsis sp. ULAP02]|uniref:bestrophin family protein n=1 Tax=Chlorogloeopsis sp. ULAP02 TaxID=3107926 RepID=UPI0031366A1C